MGGNTLALLILKDTEFWWEQSTGCSCLGMGLNWKSEIFWKKGFRSRKSNTPGLSPPFLSALTGPHLIIADPWCVSVSKGSCSAAFSGMWVLWEPLTRLCSTKGWHRWSTLGSLRVFWGLTQGSRAWGRCLHAPSAPQLQGLQPQTSLSALSQSHDKIILLPQDSTGDV